MVQWIILGYLLANAAVTPPSGYLGIRFGVKRLFLLGIALFTGFSFLCGIAPSQDWLVVFRVLQGMGGGLLLPLGMALALEPFGPEERAKAMAVVGFPFCSPRPGPDCRWRGRLNLGLGCHLFHHVPIGAAAILVNWLVLPAKTKADERGPSPLRHTGGR